MQRFCYLLVANILEFQRVHVEVLDALHDFGTTSFGGTLRRNSMVDNHEFYWNNCVINCYRGTTSPTRPFNNVWTDCWPI